MALYPTGTSPLYRGVMGIGEVRLGIILLPG